MSHQENASSIIFSSYFNLQLKYKKDLNKMKGSASAYHCLTPDDNLALKNACKINKLVSEVNSYFYMLFIKT